MKNVLFLFIVYFFVNNFGFGQDYEVEVSTETYVPLTTDTAHIYKPSTVTIGGGDYYLPIPLGFDFELQGEVFDTIYLHEDGYAGFMVGDELSKWIWMFGCDLKSYEDDDNNSPIAYKLEGTPGSRIFKCEYVSHGYENDAEDNDSINCQLWLYEECNVFEIHVGGGFNNSVESDLYWNSETSSFIGYGRLLPSAEQYHLGGDPLAPVLHDDPSSMLDTIPDAGTVYRFFNCVLDMEGQVSDPITIFPNPANNQIFLNINEDSRYETYDIYNSAGQLVLSSQIISSNTTVIDISELSKGMYWLTLIGEVETETIKFKKN